MKIEDIKQLYIRKGKVFFASMELTQNCNFHCRHCYCTDKQCENLTLEKYFDIIDKLHSIGCLLLSLTGGEILTHKYFKEIYTYAKNKGFIIDLMTNGSLINQELIDLFIELPPHNISITLYGTNEEEYQKFTGNKNNYYKVMNALRLLQKNKLNFVLRTVATPTFYDSLKQGSFEKIAEQYGTSFRYDPIIFPKTSGDKTPLNECLAVSQIIELEIGNVLRNLTWKKIIHENKPFEWKCKAGINSFAVDYRGDAYICGLYRNNPISILNNDINIVLKHLHEIHEEHINIMKTNECNSCKMRNICKWCPAYSLIYNHNQTQKVSFFCELAKARIKAFDK